MPERSVSERRDLEELLAFHANGTLTPGEAERVERALAEDPELASELALVRAVRAGLREATEVPTAGELGWGRLRRDVRRERRRALIGRTWRPALALAAGLALVIQAGLLFRLTSPVDPGAELAGGPTGHLQVTFVEEATEARIREVLREAGARIVDGPGAVGVYRLRLEPAPATEEDWRAVLAALARERDVVFHVARE